MTDKQKMKRNSRRPMLTGDAIQTVTLRTLASDREDLYREATEAFRSINAQVIDKLSAFLEHPMTDSDVEDLKLILQSSKGKEMCSFGLRLPVDLYKKLREESDRTGCSQNLIMRHAIFQSTIS